jgi:AcrR family transcriptional regulator
MQGAPSRRRRERVRPTREQTRARLIAAAHEVFVAHGYEHASLDDVAAAAGLTKGAIYSSFDGKAELFYALMQERLRERIELAANVVDKVHDIDQITSNVGGILRDLLIAQREWQLLYVEFWSVAARNPALQQAFAEHRREARQLIGSVIEGIARQRNVPLPAPSEDLAAIVLGLANGVAMEQITDPEQLRPELLVAGLQLMFQGAGAPVGAAVEQNSQDAG